MKKKLVAQIESQLGWGIGDSWTNKDFEVLSGLILEKTGKQLSVTTLKRVWGRAAVVANPSTTTFDILSEFLGYKSWRDFLHEQMQGTEGHPWTKVPPRIWKWGLGVLVLVFLIPFFWRGKEWATPSSVVYDSRTIEDEEISFSLDHVTRGYPNTVIFQYDVGKLPYDSLAIQQSWDTNKRIPLAESKGLVTSTYYMPGYFLAKLVVDNTIVEERNLYIPTSGWQGTLLGADEKISYLKDHQFQQRKTIGVVPSTLQELEAMGEGRLYLAHLSPEPVIDGTDFQLSTSFKLAHVREGSICQNIRMTVTGTREVISLEFSIPGCVGDLVFFMDGDMVSGKNHDFSAFGVHKDQWIPCTLRVSQGRLAVSIDGREVFEKELQVDLGKIGGVQWVFEGLGEIQELVLRDTQQEIDFMN